MKVLDAKINWREGSGNSPKLWLLVKGVPILSEMRFGRTEDLYYAEKDDYAYFFSYENPGNGFGGHEFKITMEDGSNVVLKGPWSSRAGVMNRAGFGPCLDVSYTTSWDGFERGIAFTAGHITLEAAKKALRHVPGAALLEAVDGAGEITYIPAKLPYIEVEIRRVIR